MTDDIKQAAAAMGRKGGRSKSKRKAAAARRNLVKAMKAKRKLSSRRACARIGGASGV